MTSDGLAPQLRIAIVRARYSGHGGAERFVERAASALGGQAELTVIARRWDLATTAERPYRFARLDPVYAGSLWRDAGFARSVRAYVAANHFDLVQSHERIAGMPLYRAGDGVHAAYLERRQSWSTAFNPHHRWLIGEERRMFEHPALRAVICNSNMVMREIAERFAIDASRLHLIRNGIDLQAFAPPSEAQRALARNTLGVEPNQRVLCLVGSGFARKGVDSGMRALQALKDPRTLLLVVGHDKQLGRYRRLSHTLGLSSRVRFLGVLADVRPVLHASDAMVLPALYDPFPNAALEALACGVPVVTSTACGVGELLARDQVLDCRAEPALWAEALHAVLAGSQAHELRHQARALALEHDLATMASHMLDLYTRLLAAPSGQAAKTAVVSSPLL